MLEVLQAIGSTMVRMEHASRLPSCSASARLHLDKEPSPSGGPASHAHLQVKMREYHKEYQANR